MKEERVTPLSFDVNNEIRPDVIERIWQGIKGELADDGYPVEAIEMPEISGWMLDWNNLQKAWATTSLPSTLRNTTLEEYGEYSEKWAACTFPLDADHPEGKWMVLVWEKKRPIRKELKHELLHIWEALLGLKWSTLVGKYSPERPEERR